jgi:hypothetical protein
MSAPADRNHFREALGGLASRMQVKIPALNGRVERACRLVLGGDVELHEDGTAFVNSLSTPTLTYQVAPGLCQCKDFDRAPEHLCCHRLAAGFLRKLLAQVPPAEETPAPVPLPEARVSINVRLSVRGHDVQITLRGEAEAEVMARLDAVLDRYAPPPPQAPSQGQPLTPQQHNAAAMHRRVSDFCPVHNVQMQLNQKEGRSWWSHRTDQGWCKGK